MTERFGNTLALAIGALLALVLSEVGLRLVAPQQTGPAWFAHDTDLGAIPVPGEHASRTLPGAYRFSFTHDAQGLRVDRAADGLVAVRTVLVLGDSFTYGLGVNDDQTYCHFLQEALRSGPPVRVVNAGSPGKGTDYALKFLLARGAALRPDLVLVAFFKNDFGENARRTYFSLTPAGALEPRPLTDSRSARRRLLAQVPGFGWLLSSSQVVNLMRQAAVVFSVDTSRPGQPVAVQGGEQDEPRGLEWVNPERRELTTRYLKALRDATAARGAPLLAFYVPDRRDCWLARAGRTPSPDESAFREITAELGLRAISLTPALATSAEHLGRLYFSDGHWTPAAHALVAGSLLEVVRANLRE